ncbi:fimbrial protein [Pseudomonas aeruginosa]|uniref:fimbrial protein n=1 Tax=Pseudomonas aeruginosa TaxID=287 RepID=UPI000F88B01C|nr:fimbrial protein [Pseudomonas aeruginosa]EKV4566555.1 type 1 fimbrial protein [Pseudomonas aeruginosa]MCV4133976.1 fimbrial protein [Pseudomonas aeruginosa]MCV4361419.1 fimbrial protein [Pseudomonas aeruginosa]MCW3884355.1 fimbrial protein [Pseudomonas aeruginosa]RUB06153.1 type 1 fimbrial protein [Pseudomonas aeruginosa]
MEFRHMLYRAIFILAALFGHVGASLAGDIYAFGGRDVAVPSILPSGSVMSRYSFTPMQMCGQPSCDITLIALYNKGSVWSPADGPDLETNVSGLSVRLLLDGKPANSKFKGSFSQIAELQLFRNSMPISGGQFASGSFNSYFLITYKSGFISTATAAVRLTGSATTIDATCQVPDRTVKLAPITASDLRGIGTTASPTSFDLVVSVCPRGFNRIGYMILPVGGAVSEGSGTLPLLSGSTAAGVSIRVTDASGTPPQLGVSLPVTEYDKNTGGFYLIPMRASYVQTAERIKGGSVLAAMVILLDYQ